MSDFKDIEPRPATPRRTLQRRNAQVNVTDEQMAQALGLRPNQLLAVEAARDEGWPEWDAALASILAARE